MSVCALGRIKHAYPGAVFIKKEVCYTPFFKKNNVGKLAYAAEILHKG